MSFGRLDGKVAIVTAAAQGIGEASATIMAKQGATVMVADINESGAAKVAAAINAAGGRASSMAIDALSEDSIKKMVEHTHGTYGRLDILHNNAGGAYVEEDLDAVTTSQSAWDRTMAWNFGSVQWGCRYAIPLMIAGGGGSIVTTVTAGASFAQSIQIAYGACKGAVASYIRYVAVQYGRQNIRCNGISPGLIMTPNAEEKMPDDVKAGIFKHSTTPRLGKPSDIGNLAAFLASEDSSYINGQIILVDGGVSVRFPHDADMVEMLAAQRA